MTHDGEQEFTLSWFLRHTSKHFTVLSVFGALSIYFAQFSRNINTPWQNVGTVASLVLFIVTAFTIRAELKVAVDGNLFDFLVKPRKDSYKLVFFVAPFYLLIATVVVVVLQYSAALMILAQLVAWLIGVSVVIWFVTEFEFTALAEGNIGELGRDSEVFAIGVYLLKLNLIGIGISVLCLFYFSQAYAYGMPELYGMTPKPGIVPLLVAFFVGILFGSVLYAVVGSLVMSFHTLIARLEDQGKLEPTAKLYQQVFMTGDSDKEQTELTDFKE